MLLAAYHTSINVRGNAMLEAIGQLYVRPAFSSSWNVMYDPEIHNTHIVRQSLSLRHHLLVIIGKVAPPLVLVTFEKHLDRGES